MKDPQSLDTSTRGEAVPVTGTQMDVMAIVLDQARAAIGVQQTGDPVPYWLQKAMANAGVKLDTVPLEYYQFLMEAYQKGKYTDVPQPGDIGILQLGAAQAYWSYVVDSVDGSQITVIIAQSFNANEQTEVRRIDVRWPDYNATWHTVGFIRF